MVFKMLMLVCFIGYNEKHDKIMNESSQLETKDLVTTENSIPNSKLEGKPDIIVGSV